jgi:hypothetical protein
MADSGGEVYQTETKGFATEDTRRVAADMNATLSTVAELPNRAAHSS